MSSPTIGVPAVARREAYRNPDGTFGRQPAGESSVVLSGSEHDRSGLVQLPDRVQVALSSLRRAGMRPMLVGGSVRDALLDPGIVPKDLDFEVYGCDSMERLAATVRPHGRVDEVGVSFGVVKLTTGGSDVDLSLPRRDSKVGDGHRGFDVVVDPDLSFEAATARRDFTINAIMWDPETG